MQRLGALPGAPNPSFNPRPALRPGDALTQVIKHGRARVSIRARP